MIYIIEKFVLELSIEKIVVGVYGDWVFYVEDFVDKYFFFYKECIIIIKGGVDCNISIEKIIEVIDVYCLFILEDIVVIYDFVCLFIIFCMI